MLSVNRLANYACHQCIDIVCSNTTCRIELDRTIHIHDTTLAILSLIIDQDLWRFSDEKCAISSPKSIFGATVPLMAGGDIRLTSGAVSIRCNHCLHINHFLSWAKAEYNELARIEHFYILHH